MYIWINKQRETVGKFEYIKMHHTVLTNKNQGPLSMGSEFNFDQSVAKVIFTKILITEAMVTNNQIWFCTVAMLKFIKGSKTQKVARKRIQSLGIIWTEAPHLSSSFSQMWTSLLTSNLRIILDIYQQL